MLLGTYVVRGGGNTYIYGYSTPYVQCTGIYLLKASGKRAVQLRIQSLSVITIRRHCHGKFFCVNSVHESSPGKISQYIMISMRTTCEHKWDPYIEENKIMLAKGSMISRSEISLRIINKMELHGNENQ